MCFCLYHIYSKHYISVKSSIIAWCNKFCKIKKICFPFCLSIYLLWKVSEYSPSTQTSSLNVHNFNIFISKNIVSLTSKHHWEHFQSFALTLLSTMVHWKIRHHNIYFFLILLKIKWFIIYSMLYTCKCNSLTWKRCFNNHNKKFELILYVRVYYPKVVVCCSLSIFFIYCFSPNQAIDILRMVFNIYIAANSIYPIH